MADSITLTGLNIWDGVDLLDADTLTITGERIESIGGPPAANSIDCAGLTAIPGLIDAHVHLELDPNEKNAPERTSDDVVTVMAERATRMVRVGITTARDLGGGAWHEVALRDAIRAGTSVGPRLLCSGQPITSPGGHCHFWGGAAASWSTPRASW